MGLVCLLVCALFCWVKNFLIAGSMLPCDIFNRSRMLWGRHSPFSGSLPVGLLPDLPHLFFTCLALEGIWVWNLCVMAHASNITSPQYPPSSLRTAFPWHLLHLLAPMLATPGWVLSLQQWVCPHPSPSLSHSLTTCFCQIAHFPPQECCIYCFFTCDFFLFVFPFMQLPYLLPSPSTNITSSKSPFYWSSSISSKIANPLSPL